MGSSRNAFVTVPGDLTEGEIAGGRYRVMRRLGAGAYGTVYQVEHIGLQKHFALKLLNAQASTNWRQISRFQQEAISASKINHPNIVSVTDVGTTDGGRSFYVMELLRGETLGGLLDREKRLSVERAIPILAATCHALHAAHEAGVVHRDLKPDNIYLAPQEDVQSGTWREVVKILDFGLAKVMEAPGLTREGLSCGTPGYMAPEQITGEEVDRRADVYAFGCVAYEMLAGQPPYSGPPLAVALAHCEKPVPPLDHFDGGQTPARMRRLVENCLQKEPEQRTGTCLAVLEELRQVAMEILSVDESDPGALTELRTQVIRKVRSSTMMDVDEDTWWDDFRNVAGTQISESGEPALRAADSSPNWDHTGETQISPTVVELRTTELEEDDGERTKVATKPKPGAYGAAADQELVVIATAEPSTPGVEATHASAPSTSPDIVEQAAEEARRSLDRALDAHGWRRSRPTSGSDPGGEFFEATHNVDPNSLAKRDAGWFSPRLRPLTLMMIWMGALSIVVLTLVIVLSTRSKHDARPKGALVVNVNPADAKILINGAPGPTGGATRVINELPAAEVEVVASHHKCKPLKKLIRIEPGHAVVVSLELPCGR